MNGTHSSEDAPAQLPFLRRGKTGDGDMEKNINESCINSIYKAIILLFSQDNLFDLLLTFIL